MSKMADDDVNMSDGEIRSPLRARGKLRGGERQRSRSRSRSFSRGRRRSSYWSPHRKSPDRRRRNARDDRRRRRDRSTTTKDRPLSTGRTISSASQVTSVTQQHIGFDHQCKIRSYDNDGDEVVLVSSASKPKLQRMRETFDEYEGQPSKRQKPLETVQVDILKHQPALDPVNQSTEGFLDLEDIPSSLVKPTTIKPRNSIAFFTVNVSPETIIDQQTHLDRMMLVPGDNDVNVDDMDITTPHIFEAPQLRRSEPDISYSNLIVVGERRWEAKTASPFEPFIPAIPLTQHKETWNVDDWKASAENEPVPQPSITALRSLAQLDGTFAKPFDGPYRLPPPLSATPSYSRIMSPPIPGQISPVVSAGPQRTHQQIYASYLLEYDRVEKENAGRRKRQRTIKYEVFDEEVEVILARMTFNAENIACTTQELTSKPSQSFVRLRENRKFLSDPANLRLNEKDFPLSQYNDGQASFDRLMEVHGKAMASTRGTRPAKEDREGDMAYARQGEV